jgi:hypothetical protein
VAVQIDIAVAAEWLDWMRRVHVPEVMATGCFLDCHLAEVVEPPAAAGRAAFAIEYAAPSLATLRQYQARYAPGLQRSHTERYAGRFEASRSIRVLIGGPAPPG